MRKVLVVMCLMALGGGIAAGAIFPQKLVLTHPIVIQNQPKVITSSPMLVKKAEIVPSTKKLTKSDLFFSSPLTATLIPPSEIKYVLLSSPSVKIFQGEDTLRYDDYEEGDTLAAVTGQGAAYVAMRFTPPETCALKGIMVGIAATTGAQSDFCVWDDDGGLPGMEVVGPYRMGWQQGAYIYTINFEENGIEPYVDPDDFWIGVVIGQNVLHILCDREEKPDYPDREAIGAPGNWHLFSEEPEIWPEGAGDLIIRAIVSYEIGPGVEEKTKVSKRAMLEPNNPNPFTKETQIRFHIPNPCKVSLNIYNTTGELVRSIIDGRLSAGTHEVSWDSRDDTGRRLPSGIYFYRLTAGESTEAGKLVVIE